MRTFKTYIIFWLSQSVSQLGSAMTGFALILWAYTKSHAALTVSLLSFCNYVPYILVSLFAGTFVDRHNKKIIMLTADSAAAVCTVVILAVSAADRLQLWHIYLANGIIGCMNAFQGPASSVAIGRIVPKDKIANASGMSSFSDNLIMVLSPVLAAFVLSCGGLKWILWIDLGSFCLAFLVLAFLIHVPEKASGDMEKKSILKGCGEGFRFLHQNKGIWLIVLTMALLNFFSRLTYENILSPMILSRSGNDSAALGMVNAMIGLGGIVGGLLVSMGWLAKDNIKMIYIAAAVSFLCGDLVMGVGKNTVMWSIAGVAASLPIPFITAGQRAILYKRIPDEMQGRVFAVRNAIQFSTIPIGILLGGWLADYVFEPFMASEHGAARILHRIVGSGAGSGMAVMFLCTGILGSVFSYLSYHRKEIQELRS